MQRRQHAEELLEWKRRLDAEEAEIQQMEKQALAAWDKELVKPKTPKKELESQRTEQKGNEYKLKPNMFYLLIFGWEWSKVKKAVQLHMMHNL